MTSRQLPRMIKPAQLEELIFSSTSRPLWKMKAKINIDELLLWKVYTFISRNPNTNGNNYHNQVATGAISVNIGQGE